MGREKDLAIAVEHLDRLIHEIRGQKMMLDRDLAALYGVETKALKRAVKRNAARFPADFMFELTAEEYGFLRCQIGTLKRGEHAKYLPYAFTEQGVAMLSSVLRSQRAVQVNILIMRAFVRMRAVLSGDRQLARKLAALEKELKGRLDVHESAIVTILQRVMDSIDPPALPEPPKKNIGFQVQERRSQYPVRTRKPRRYRS